VESATGVSLFGSEGAGAAVDVLRSAAGGGGVTDGAGMPMSVAFVEIARAVGVSESCVGGKLFASGGVLGAAGALLGRTGRGLTELGRGGFSVELGRGGALTALGG
jgi:hypothetical protein